VTAGAATRREGAGAKLDRGPIFHRDQWPVDRVPIDRGVADILQRPGDDAKVGLGRGDIIKAAEEEHGRGNRNDDGQSADRLRNFIVNLWFSWRFQVRSNRKATGFLADGIFVGRSSVRGHPRTTP
jgi:hypothetical protein